MEILNKILRYRRGEGEYDFSGIENEEERANRAYDAWMEIEAEIESILFVLSKEGISKGDELIVIGNTGTHWVPVNDVVTVFQVSGWYDGCEIPDDEVACEAPDGCVWFIPIRDLSR